MELELTERMSAVGRSLPLADGLLSARSGLIRPIGHEGRWVGAECNSRQIERYKAAARVSIGRNIVRLSAGNSTKPY